ncbi:hypothetical protein AVEN_179525-1 [Araneus ventricosus]|uniref:Uncharacterized protein n=1 Tax=Araneus ventricosus TaxID=182803 RepID=A0A4Y2NZP5_ARAVE|nr:hypothetical protein AVEN_179525-1 [Araneus ventricosus]
MIIRYQDAQPSLITHTVSRSTTFTHNPYRTEIHNFHSYNLHSIKIHNLHSYNLHSIKIHNLHSYNLHSIKIHNLHSYNLHSIKIHNLHSYSLHEYQRSTTFHSITCMYQNPQPSLITHVPCRRGSWPSLMAMPCRCRDLAFSQAMPLPYRDPQPSLMAMPCRDPRPSLIARTVPRIWPSLIARCCIELCSLHHSPCRARGIQAFTHNPCRAGQYGYSLMAACHLPGYTAIRITRCR